MFYIRADANQTIATGHIMRCLSIADALRKAGTETTFITADHQADKLILSRNYSVFCLESVWNDLSVEIGTLKKYILDNTIKSMLVDTYYADDAYLKEISSVTNVTYLDDLGIVTCPVQQLLNYNIYAEDIDYRSLFGSQPRLLLGPSYAPLREEFQNLTPVFREQACNIFISTGGTDSFQIAPAVLEKIIESPFLNQYDYYVISGAFNSSLPLLEELAAGHDKIHICRNVTQMADLMLACDIAISACGSTMYELCACGVPIITFSFADNQLPGIRGFAKRQAAIVCGDARDGVEKLADTIADRLKYLLAHNEERHALHERGRMLVDGAGAQRVAEVFNTIKKVPHFYGVEQ